jgi:N-hydroxyarylamine O-acetyltransferase
MEMTDFPLSQYLARIGLNTAPEPDESGLRQVHLAQAYSIPFEDFDIHLGRGISLNPKDLIAKLILQRRGGYCFELNGLLVLALKSLGFMVRPQLARVLYMLKDPSPRTHEVLLVTISGHEWLADVGFGGPGLREPIPLVEDQVFEQGGAFYRLKRDARYGWTLQKKAEDGFFAIYVFDENEVTLDNDIEMANHYTATWPQSIFRLQRMAALPTPQGRITLADMELTVYQNGETTSRTLQPGPSYIAAISEYFGIDLDARDEEWNRDVGTEKSGKI